MNLKIAVEHSKIPFALSLVEGGAGFWNAHQKVGGVEAAHASTSSARTASTRSNCGF